MYSENIKIKFIKLNDKINFTKNGKYDIEILKNIKNYTSKILKKMHQHDYASSGHLQAYNNIYQNQTSDFQNDFSYKDRSHDDAKKRKRVIELENEDDNENETEIRLNKTQKANSGKKKRRSKLQIIEDDLVLLRDNLKASPRNKHIQDLINSKEKLAEELKLKNKNNKNKRYNNKLSTFNILDNNNKKYPSTPKSVVNKLIDKSKRQLINSSGDKRISNKQLHDKVYNKSIETFNYEEEDSIIIDNPSTLSSITNSSTDWESGTMYSENVVTNNSTPSSGFQNSDLYGRISVNSNSLHLSQQTNSITPHLNNSTQQINNNNQQQIRTQQNTTATQQNNNLIYHNISQNNNQNIPYIASQKDGSTFNSMYTAQQQVNKTNNDKTSQNKPTTQQNDETEDDLINKNRFKYNASTSNEVNIETEAIINDFTMLFEGQYISNYRYNYEQLNQEFKKNYGEIPTKEITLIDIGFDKEGRQIPRRLMGSVSVLKSICYLKIVLFDNDFKTYEMIKSSREIMNKAFGGIKMSNRHQTLAVHTNIGTNINLDDQDIVKSFKQYGVSNAKRINGSRTCKLEFVELKAWANICKYGIRLRNKHSICSNWEQRPKKCRKCHALGHLEHDNSNNCVERCDRCGEKKHTDQCSHNSYNCINCKSIGVHSLTNDFNCQTYIEKKKELNKKYDLIFELLHLKPEDYNKRTTNTNKTMDNQATNITNETIKENIQKFMENSDVIKNFRKEIDDMRKDVNSIKSIGENMGSNMLSINEYFKKLDNKMDQVLSNNVAHQPIQQQLNDYEMGLSSGANRSDTRFNGQN
jgi:hypothetical protein